MIKNLSRQLNEAGKIKIGKKGAMITSAKGNEFRPPKKLDHFQLTTTEKDKNSDYIIDVDLQNKIKKSGSGILDQNGCLTGLPIRLLYNDTELNFPHRYVSYVSGRMSCYGDGEESFKRIDDFKEPHPCPCDRINQGYDGKDKCKPSASLVCIIDEAGLFGQAHKFRTTSMNTIKGILGGIELIKTATGGKIAGLPLMLTMNAKQTTTPQGISTTIYIVSICYRGSMADLREEVLQLLSTEKQYLLSMDTMEDHAKQAAAVEIVDREEEQDFVEEFFPDAVDVDGAIEVKNDAENTEVEPETETEQGPSQDQVGTESEERSQESSSFDRTILEPVGPYKKIYEQFIAETDIDKAMGFAKRLQKGNLLYWIVNTYPDIEFEQNIKKPEALELVLSILTTTLTKSNDKSIVDNTQPGNQIDETLHEESASKQKLEPTEEQIEEQTEESTTKTATETTEYVSTWDDSHKIDKEQLRELVRLKAFLEKEGILRPDKWVDHVKFFTDAAGLPIEKAIALTTKQGETFIEMLGNSITK